MVFVLVEDTLTRAERELVRNGDEDRVLRVREELQRVMHEPRGREIERPTGRAMVGFMSTNHVDPDLAVEIFMFAPDGSHGRTAHGEVEA